MGLTNAAGDNEANVLLLRVEQEQGHCIVHIIHHITINNSFRYFMLKQKKNKNAALINPHLVHMKI